MKKLLLVAALFGAMGAVQAQEFSVGARAGLSLANVGGDVEDNSMKIGAVVGANMSLMLSDKFSLGSDLVFSMQGAKYELGEEEANFNLNYLNIPIYAKVYPVDGMGLHILAGIQPGILMSATVDDDDVKDSFKALDISIPLGAGYELENGLGFDVRYNLGVASIDDSEGDEDTKITNQVIQIGVNYRFEL